MRLFFLILLSLPFFFPIVHQLQKYESEEINDQAYKPKDSREHYILSTQEKSELITGINLWIELIANTTPAITQELVSFFDEIMKTYPKKGPSDGISAEKLTKWGRINLFLRMDNNLKGKNSGNISISDTEFNIIFPNFSQDNFTKDLGLRFINKNKIVNSDCARLQKDGTCINPYTSIYYEYKYQSIKYPNLLITFGIGDKVEKYNDGGVYPKKFSSIFIETKPNQ
ncbi:hypothetical protein [Citrobacter portucalensis]|uniref:Uncharacterized protein n=1 Tax=Citrobacter portucalensis TaxID=1639133 RepID=A0A9X4GME1_9ENTR|nr:hypothetical protein [Citrobacter portucalensis]MDE9618604.1 hypothetical protein [Citrobacter portucalensis]